MIIWIAQRPITGLSFLLKELVSMLTFHYFIFNSYMAMNIDAVNFSIIRIAMMSRVSRDNGFMPSCHWPLLSRNYSRDIVLDLKYCFVSPISLSLIKNIPIRLLWNVPSDTPLYICQQNQWPHRAPKDCFHGNYIDSWIMPSTQRMCIYFFKFFPKSFSIRK